MVCLYEVIKWETKKEHSLNISKIPSNNGKKRGQSISITYIYMIAHLSGLYKVAGLKQLYCPNLPFSWNDAVMHVFSTCG